MLRRSFSFLSSAVLRQRHSQVFKELDLLFENPGVFDGTWGGSGPVRVKV
jgi:hypothetical protein